MVAHIVRSLYSALAFLWLADGAYLDLVVTAPDIQQEDVKHQHGIWGNDATFQWDSGDVSGWLTI